MFSLKLVNMIDLLIWVIIRQRCGPRWKIIPTGIIICVVASGSVKEEVKMARSLPTLDSKVLRPQLTN
jgi:hypothetical protein